MSDHNSELEEQLTQYYEALHSMSAEEALQSIVQIAARSLTTIKGLVQICEMEPDKPDRIQMIGMQTDYLARHLGQVQRYLDASQG